MTRPRAVWLVAGGAMQRPAITIARELGLALVVSDGSAACALHDSADAFVHADTFDIDAHVAAAEAVLRSFDVVGVMTFAADCHVTVAGLARHLGLHGVPVETALTCRNKDMCRDVLRAAGLPQPRCRVVTSLDEARDFARTVGVPVVLKATDNSGSRGFFPVPAGAQITDADLERTRGYGTRGSVIIEEALIPIADGIAEQSVETAWVDGEFFFLNWVDRLFPRDIPRLPVLAAYAEASYPDGVELGHVNPSMHGEPTRRAVENVVLHAGRALGFNRLPGGHILKADIMLTARGPVVIEATPRLSGGWDSSASSPARGARLIEAAMLMATGCRDREILAPLFSYPRTDVVAAVAASIPEGAQDCIGRTFALGTAPTANEAYGQALASLNRGTILS